jgi:2-methylcitrate dehydratase PrpD
VTATPDASVRLAEHVVGRRSDLPPAVSTAVKIFVLDSLGVAVAGSGEPWSAPLAETVAGWGVAAESTVWVDGRRLPAQSAALVNAWQLHCLEFDCIHERAIVHPMATLLPAVLAWAERAGPVSGRDVLMAVALGVDVAATLGIAARGPLRFFRPATAGAFGAVAAVGRLAGLDATALTHAFGIVYGAISGTMQPHDEGSRVLAMQMGFNARAALAAIDLAARGLEGPRRTLEGAHGYFALFEAGAADPGAALRELGAVWHVTRLSHKPFPSGRLTHGAIDALQQLRAGHAFTAAEVEAITVAVPPLVHRLVGRPDLPAPAPAYARLCLPFVAATTLIRGTVDVPDFTAERLLDPRVHALAQRVRVVDEGGADAGAIVPQTVEVTLANQRRHAVRLDAILGHPDRPLSRAAHLAKFRRNWRHAARPLDPARGERLIDLVDRLEEVPDVRAVTALLV